MSLWRESNYYEDMLMDSLVFLHAPSLRELKVKKILGQEIKCWAEKGSLFGKLDGSYGDKELSRLESYILQIY